MELPHTHHRQGGHEREQSEQWTVSATDQVFETAVPAGRRICFCERALRQLSGGSFENERSRVEGSSFLANRDTLGVLDSSY